MISHGKWGRVPPRLRFHGQPLGRSVEVGQNHQQKGRIVLAVTVTLEPFGDAVKEAYLQLLPAHEQVVARGKLEWKFARNPAGAGVIAVARDEDGVLLGMNAFQKACFVRSLGERTIGAQSMDTIVMSEARGQGVFSKLLAAFSDRAPVDLLYGFPNDQSSHHFFGKGGWSLVGPVPMLFRPLRTGVFSRRVVSWLPDVPLPKPLARGGAWEAVDCFDDWADGAWQRMRSGVSCAVDRSAEYLNWRFMAHPSERYTVLRSPAGSWVAFTVVDKHGGRIGYLMDAVGDPDDLDGLIVVAIRAMAKRQADVVFAWNQPWSPNHAAHRRAGLYPLPDRIRPIHLNFGGRTLKQGAAAIPPEDWYISYLDSDTV